MSELATQLRAYYEATTAPVDVATIADRPVPSGLQIVDDFDAVQGAPAGRGPVRRWMAVAASIAALALIAGLIYAGTRTDEEPAPADEPPTSAPADPDPATGDLPAELDSPGRPLPAGRYGTELLGVELLFEIPDDMLLAAAKESLIVVAASASGDELSYPPSNRDWTPDNVEQLVFARIDGWSTRDEASDTSADAASIDPYDVDGWIASNDLTLVTDEQQTIAGRPARVFEVDVDPGSGVRAGTCLGIYQPCFFSSSVSSATDASRARESWVSASVDQRFYLITIDESEPLLITATAPVGSDWIDVVEGQIISTLALGPDAPPLGIGD